MEKPRDNKLLYGVLGAVSGFVLGPIPGIIAGFMQRGKEKDLATLEGRAPQHGWSAHPITILAASFLVPPIAGALYGMRVADTETKTDMAANGLRQQQMVFRHPAMGARGPVTHMAMTPQQQMASTQWRDHVNNQRAQAALMQEQQR